MKHLGRAAKGMDLIAEGVNDPPGAAMQNTLETYLETRHGP
jgi:hypothetical protein